MINCSQCGDQLSAGDRFCTTCGASVSEISEMEKPPERGQESQLTDNQGKNTRTSFNEQKGYRAKAIIIALLAIVLAAGGFWGWKSYGSPEVQAQNKLDMAIKYVTENNFEQAILAYNEAIRINPKEVQAYQGLAKVYILQGNFDNAQTTYEQGLKAVVVGDKIKLELGLAASFIDKKDYAQARSRFQQLLTEDKSNLDAYRGLALVYQADNKPDQAKAILKQCITANPTDYRAFNAIADNETYYEAAQPYLAQSLELEINQQEAYAILNRVYNPQLSNSDFWVAAMSKSAINPQVAPMLRFYAYYRDGKFDKALAEYNSNLANNAANLKARALAAVCMVKAGDNAGAARLIADIEKNNLYNKVQIDVAYYYSLINQMDKARTIAIEVLSTTDPDLGSLQLAAQILGSDSPNVQIAATKYITQQWLPIAAAVKELRRIEVKTSVSIPTADPLDFIKINYPNLYENQNYRITKMELTADNVNETILTGWPNAFVLKTHGNTFQVLYENDFGHYGFDQPMADKYQDLYLTSHSGGTGCQVANTVILRWDGSQLREIWSGETKNHNDSGGMQDTLLVDENATITITGNNQPEQLTYVKTGRYGHYPTNGQQVWDKEETVTKEFTFDAGQFKFIESSSKTDTKPLNSPTLDQNGVGGDEKIAVLQAAKAYFEGKGLGPIYLAPPYGNPPKGALVAVLSDFDSNSAKILIGTYQTSDATRYQFRMNASGNWVYDSELDDNSEGW